MKTWTTVAVMVFMMMAGQGTGIWAIEPQQQQSSQAGRGAAQSPPSESVGQFLNMEGTLKEIQGDTYILESEGGGRKLRFQVGKDTAFPNGEKEPGQSVQALVVARTGHALIVR
jgi:hypothetical protein